MNRDQLKGRIKLAEGATAEAIGKLTNNPLMEHKGSVRKAAGKVQLNFGNFRNRIPNDE